MPLFNIYSSAVVSSIAKVFVAISDPLLLALFPIVGGKKIASLVGSATSNSEKSGFLGASRTSGHWKEVVCGIVDSQPRGGKFGYSLNTSQTS